MANVSDADAKGQVRVIHLVPIDFSHTITSYRLSIVTFARAPFSDSIHTSQTTDEQHKHKRATGRLKFGEMTID